MSSRIDLADIGILLIGMCLIVSGILLTSHGIIGWILAIINWILGLSFISLLIPREVK